MIKLEKNLYFLLKEPLKQVAVNTFFVRAVLEQKVEGKVFVDNIENPQTYYVVHKYGMSLLFGKSDNELFNSWFADYCFNRKGERNHYEWMQAFPADWDTVLPRLFADKLVDVSETAEAPNDFIERNTRVNFKFNIDKYLAFKENNIKESHHVVRTDASMFHEMKGVVVPANFWDSADDFCKNGVGFSLFYQHKLATTAYSAFIFEDILELGMETQPEFRGKGFAQYACATLIDYCIANHLEPVWACKLQNKPSYNLARKLGFEPSITLPYYRLAL